MNIKKVLFCLACSITINTFAMDSSNNAAVNQTQLALIKTIYRELGAEKSSEESALLLKNMLTKKEQESEEDNQRKSLYVPWRKAYISKENTSPTKPPCPFCDQLNQPSANDQSNLLLERHKNSAVFFNLNGLQPLHLLILPRDHKAKMSDLSQETRVEILTNAQRWIQKLKKFGFEGYITFNLEDKCAGASIPDHLHCQLFSRCEGDTSEAFDGLRELLIAAERHSLLPCFYDFAQKNTPTPQGSEALSPKSTGDDSLKLARIYTAYAQLLSSMQTPLEKKASKPCRACSLQEHKDDETDKNNLTVQRFTHWLLKLNRNGYAAGDSFLITKEHGKSYATLTQEELSELAELLPHTQENLRESVKVTGFDIGSSTDNGIDAQFKDHVCFEIVPRNNVDTGAIHVFFYRTAIQDNLRELRKKLIERFNNNSKPPSHAQKEENTPSSSDTKTTGKIDNSK